MKKYIFILLFVNFNIFCYSQIKLNDSVNNLIKQVKESILNSNYQESLDYAIQTVNYAHKTNEDYSISEAYVFLGTSYLLLKENKNAERNFNLAIEYGKKSNNNLMLMSSYNGLGNIYSEFYHNIDLAVDYYKKSSEYANIAGKPNEGFMGYINIAWTLLDYNKTNEAYQYLVKAREMLNKSKEPLNIYNINIEHQFGRYYTQKKNYNTALTHLNEALKIANNDSLHGKLIDIYKSQSKLYQDTGKYDLAIESLNKSLYFQDINFKKQKNKKIEKARAKFEFDEVQRELEKSEQEKNSMAKITSQNKKILLISIAAIILLIILIILMVYIYNKRKVNYILKADNKVLLQAKNNAERLNKLKSKFISRISHELRTPLYGIVGITSILKEDKDIVSKHKELINGLRFSGNHLINLVNNAIKVSNIESQNILLNETNVNLKLLANNIVDSLKFQFGEKGNELQLIISNDLAKNYILDSVKLSEILINLIDNANKFTENGTITFSISAKILNEKHHTILFKIEDTGIGISEENKLTVFDSFNQLRKEENTEEGSGLGLNIVKTWLELMNSEISIESKVNIGSTFSFALDLSIGGDTQQKVIKKASLVNSKTILVVEDNKVSQKITSNLLKIIGHKSIVAENGKIATEKVISQDFDLVLMDINMPVMNGYDATLKIMKYNPKLNIIGLTANELTEVYDKCIACGMKDVINKPLTKKDLNRVINKFISNSSH